MKNMEECLMLIQQKKNHLISIIVGVAVFFLLIGVQVITAYAAPQHAFGTGQGRTDVVRENDYHTASWERYVFNYQIISGANQRHDFGRATTLYEIAPAHVLSLNIRRDANVALRPPSYGVFSATLDTAPANHLFAQPVNPHFHQAFIWEDTSLSPRFDTTGQGINAPILGNQSNMFNVSQGYGFLPPTSTDFAPIVN